MTIMVYDPERDRFLVDSCHEASVAYKDRFLTQTKINVTRNGHMFAASGKVDEDAIGVMIDAAFSRSDGPHVMLIDVPEDDTTIFVRHSDGTSFISNRFNGKLVLARYRLSAPFSCASGGFFFDAYYAEHKSIDVAMELTCRYAYGCGLPVESF